MLPNINRQYRKYSDEQPDGLLTNTTVCQVSQLCCKNWTGLLYQITNGIVATPHIPYLLSYRHAPRSSRRANTLKHATYQCRTNYFKYSYFPHTVVLWNSLPQAVVSSPTLEAFKTYLRRCRMPQIYNSDNVRGDIVITL